MVLFAPVCVVPSCVYKPILASPVTQKGATKTSGVVFHDSQSSKLFLRRTPLAFSLFGPLLIGGEQH